MAHQIEQLTPEQEAMLPIFRDYWIGRGLSTEPADRALAEEGIREAYEAAGLPPPPKIHWVKSPNEVVMLQASLMTWAWARSLAKMPSREKMIERMRQEIKEWSSRICYGNHEASFLSYYWAFLKFGIKECERINGLFKIGQSANWWAPFDTCCIICERPSVLHLEPAVPRDPNADPNDPLPARRLHCIDGPAIQWPDGWGVYAIRGARVPEKYFTEPVTVEDVMNEPNVEVKRVLVEEKFGGWGEFAEALGAKPMKHLPNYKDDWGELWWVEMPAEGLTDNGQPLVFVRVIDSSRSQIDGTRRPYTINVPPTIKSPLEGIAWSFNLSVEEYLNVKVMS